MSAARSAHVALNCSSFSSGTKNLQHKPQIKQLLVDSNSSCACNLSKFVMLHASSLGGTSSVNCWSAPEAGVPVVVGEGFRLFHGCLWRALAC